MRKKPLTIGDRVDILLREGVDNPKKWAMVHDYEEPEDVVVGGDAWQAEYQRLRKHHLEETNFLFDMLRELVKRYDMLDDQFASSMVDPSMEDD